MANVEKRHWWFVARRRILWSLISALELRPDADILEIGCGTGGNLEMLSSFGVVRAMEMDDKARRIADKKGKLTSPVASGSCPHNVPFKTHRFDLVCMFDVLEHVEEDTDTLSVAKDRLRAGGRLLITVPAYNWMWSTHDEFLHHKRRYAAKELRQKLVDRGLTVERISYFNTFLFPLAVVSRFTASSRRPGAEVPKKPLNHVLCAIFSFERSILKRGDLPFGLSLFAMARMP